MVLGLVLQAEALRASSFRVTPIQVRMSGKSSTLLTLTNESNDALRFQISAFAWAQGPNGEIQLTPTGDITFFPALLTLGAGQERKVRVGSNVDASAAEKTYRIFFEELPPAETTTARKSNEVRILTKMGIPIFIEPKGAVAEGRITDLSVNRSRVTFRVANSGTLHFSIRKVHVALSDDTEAKLFEHDLDGWYVLAGGYREYAVDIPAAVCPRVSNVSVEVNTDIAATAAASQLSVQQRVPAGAACQNGAR